MPKVGRGMAHGPEVYCDHCIALGNSRDDWKRKCLNAEELQRETLGAVRQRDEEIRRLTGDKANLPRRG